MSIVYFIIKLTYGFAVALDNCFQIDCYCILDKDVRVFLERFVRGVYRIGVEKLAIKGHSALEAVLG